MRIIRGRKALVTGAAAGIGRAIALALAREGADLFLVDIDAAKLEAVAREARELGVAAIADLCDLSDAARVSAAVERLTAAWGGLDILVNNAGVTRDNIFVRLSDDAWDQVIAVNLTAAFRLARGAVRGMMRRRYGRIIGITSVVGVTGNAGQGNYAAAKAGLIGMTKALAREVASRNVTVNCVAPGLIDTAMTAALNDKQKNDLLETVPAGRFGTADEAAAAVVFLASAEAAYVTGHTLHVNGGMAMI
jgi:3-oxoacyl-[acyl-carrier protein] reductase